MLAAIITNPDPAVVQPGTPWLLPLVLLVLMFAALFVWKNAKDRGFSTLMFFVALALAGAAVVTAAA